MALITLGSGKSFHAFDPVSIFEAATKSNISLPYSCKTGRCSTCRCRVISGITRALHPETGLSEQEKTEGWILSCVRTVETDVQIQIDDLSGVELPAPKTLPCRISEIKPLATDVVRVLLRLPPAADFEFIPGQYIDLIGPNGIRRSYSIANVNSAEKVIELHIRDVRGGTMSDYLFRHAKPNDLLRLNGPLGTFFLRETKDLDLIFLATGTGIAPVKAMLESIPFLHASKTPRSVTVLWGAREHDDHYFNVANLPLPHIYIPVLSRPSSGWDGVKGYVQDALLARKPDLSNAAVYACGSNVMIQSARALLIEKGLHPNSFYSDAFVSSGAN